MKRGFLKNGLSGGTSEDARSVTTTSQSTAPQKTIGDKLLQSNYWFDNMFCPETSSTHPPPQIYQAKSGLALTSKSGLQELVDRQGIKTGLLQGPPRNAAVLGFGCDSEGDADTLVITWVENRIPLREHACFDQTLCAELAASNGSVVEVSPVLGKGLGLIAKRDISAGEVIIRERPLLFVHYPVAGPLIMEMDNLVQNMPKDRKAAFYRLHNSKPRGPHMVDSMSIIRTNALDVGEQFGRDQHLCVFDLISRANHDCTPNAFFVWNFDTFCGELRSAMPIRAGTAITISYTEVFSSPAERKAELKQKWGFDCTCPACDETSPIFQASKERRQILDDYRQTQKIDQIMQAQGRWNGYEDSYIEHILDLVNKERLFVSRATVLAGLADWEAMPARFTGDYSRVVHLCRRGLDELDKLGLKKNEGTRLELNNLLEQAGVRKNIKKAEHPGDYDEMSLQEIIADLRLREDTPGPFSSTADNLQRHLAQYPEDAQNRLQQAKEMMKAVMRAGKLPVTT